MAARTCLWAAGVFEVSAGACFGAAFSLEMGVAVAPMTPGHSKLFLQLDPEPPTRVKLLLARRHFQRVESQV